MPQTSNKTSSFIGIILLLLVIGFTVFMNFSSKDSARVIEKIQLDEGYEPFDSVDLVNFWKLEGIDTKLLESESIDDGTYIQINKKITNQKYIIPPDSVLNKLSDSIQQFYKKEIDKSSLYTFMVNYGELQFKNSNRGDFRMVKENHNSVKLNEIGNIFLKYYINSISTDDKYGDFTTINLDDGRKIMLIRQNVNIKDAYHRKISEEAHYLNDSTKIRFPY